MRIGEKDIRLRRAGTNRKVLTKGLCCVLLFPLPACPRSLSPLPTKPLEPENGRHWKRCGRFHAVRMISRPRKPHKGPIHEHSLRFPAGQDDPRRTRRAGGGVSSALPRRHSHAGTTQGSHVLQPPRGRQAPPSGAVPVHRRPVRPERRSGDALRRLAGNDPHVLPHPRRSARDG